MRTQENGGEPGEKAGGGGGGGHNWEKWQLLGGAQEIKAKDFKERKPNI